MCDALVTSLKVGAIATITATMLGTMIAFALVGHRFRGHTLSLVFLPMATPEIVLGASLLTIFVQGFSKVGLQLGFWTIVIAHIMFCLSFVVVTVKARLQSLDPRLEEAAADLYANPTARSGGSPSRSSCRASSRRRCSRSRSASTTSSSPTSSPATPRRSPSSSTCPTCAGSRAGQRHRLQHVLIAVLLVILGQVIRSRRRS